MRASAGGGGRNDAPKAGRDLSPASHMRRSADWFCSGPERIARRNSGRNLSRRGLESLVCTTHMRKVARRRSRSVG